ncbi:hypothetical protein [Nitrosomonas communis]|uniref:Copper chaperone PCu(A)C n=1 Tax=Nitrosomonas communis TaxID=44574 RepID=A0A1H2T6Q7_9PROT|nr:hypothetical protein [Nitrosomonas communis]SDW39562.1 hypothetical protein SAMN05421882_10104 [Nitrosomonas communis]
MRRLVVTSVLLSMMLMMSHFALAHTEGHLATLTPPNGGQLRASGPFHLELVAKNGELTLYITDHGDNPIPTSGGQGKANIQAGKEGKKQSVVLEPVYANIMKAKGDFQITPETTVAVFLAIPGYETQGANFMPLASNGEGGEHHHHHYDHDAAEEESNKHTH